MSTQRYAVEFGNQDVGVAVRVVGGFMFISSDARFDKLDGKVFPRARALARQLDEMCASFRLTARGDDRSQDIATQPFPVRTAIKSPTPATQQAGARS